MKANIVFHDGYVKIEYQHNGTRTRKSTGVPIPNKSYLKANNELKSTVNNHEKKQDIINTFYSKAEDIIEKHHSTYKAYPTGEQFKRAWENHDKQVKKSKFLLEYFNKFYTVKETEFKRVGFNPDSIKDYRNIRYYLEDYVTGTGKPIHLDEINRDWMNRFVRFLETKRDDYDTNRKKGVKYWTKGGLRPITIKRRIGLFIGFLKWMADEKLFELPKGLANYFGSIKDSEAIKATITKEEANRLYKYDFNDTKLNYIKDVFILSCFTGARWEDIRSLNRKDFVEISGLGLCIKKVAKKTKSEFCVPVNKVVLEIVTRYNYDFTRYNNANFNKYLKILLMLTGWFDDETKFDEDGVYLKRWECISIHRGRDSFCTMMLSAGVPVNEVMKCTGHKSIVNLNRYIDLNAKREKSFTAQLVL